MIAYSSPFRELAKGTEYAPKRGFKSTEGQFVMKPNQVLDVLDELRGVYVEWERKYASLGKVWEAHPEATGAMLPHSCSGIDGSAGGGIFELHKFKPKNSCLLGISKRSF